MSMASRILAPLGKSIGPFSPTMKKHQNLVTLLVACEIILTACNPQSAPVRAPSPESPRRRGHRSDGDRVLHRCADRDSISHVGADRGPCRNYRHGLVERSDRSSAGLPSISGAWNIRRDPRPTRRFPRRAAKPLERRLRPGPTWLGGWPGTCASRLASVHWSSRWTTCSTEIRSASMPMEQLIR